MASQAYAHQSYGDSNNDAPAHMSPSSSQSPSSNASLKHTLNVKDELSSPERTTSAQTCPYSCCALPTWKPDSREMRMCEEPRQHHLHHHHHHYHYYQCPAACSCPSNGSSPSTAKQAERSQIVSHTHVHTHLSAHKTHPCCPFHAAQHTHRSLFSAEHTHCPLHPEEHTHIAPCPTEYTHITPTTDQLTEHTHSPITPSTDHLTKHPHTTPSTERTLIPSISRFQKSIHTDTDLYAAPPVHRKKPKKPKTQKSKLYTPFPSPSAPPYILCQHCFKLLSLPLSPPLYLLTLAPVLKLKCALCTRTSFFSTRRMPSPSDTFHLGHRHIHALKASKGMTDGDFHFKVHVPTFEADVPTYDASSKDEGFLLSLKENSMDAHLTATRASIDGHERKQKSRDTHVPIIDTLAVTGIPHIKEQEIMDANVLIDDIIAEGCAQGNYSPSQSPPKLNPEFAGFSSVQDWVNSIEQESFLHCPTPLLGTGFGSDLQLQEPIDWQIDDEHGGDMCNLPVPGSPLHEHFGYKSPSELLNKTLSSDDEIKMPSDTNSSASTSATSANTFTPPGFEKVDRSAYKNGSKGAFVKQVSKNSIKGSADVEESDQVSLANFFRRSLKRFGEGKSSSVSSPKSKVTVNGHTLSQLALKRAEERAGKLRPGTYWYDSKAGFWGIIGGPCLGVLPPFIEELQYPMSRDCSNGDTQIFVNGRELHYKDLSVLALRGLSRKQGMAYAIGFDGVVIEETSGRELKHLGKLAPTVERKGKGFGMYVAKQ